ncbi:19554_t:CDS:1 [Rhizophagus irregularis]|nr:19554_t:CDS:1 [Rhizophagus irregularis]
MNIRCDNSKIVKKNVFSYIDVFEKYSLLFVTENINDHFQENTVLHEKEYFVVNLERKYWEEFKVMEIMKIHQFIRCTAMARNTIMLAVHYIKYLLSTGRLSFYNSSENIVAAQIS